MGARGDFYDYRDKDGLGRVYEVHRRSIHPAMRVCKEWGFSFGEGIPDEGVMRVMFDDSIIQDVAVEKAQDMAEVGVTMNAWEYRAKWYGEDEKTAKARACGLAKGTASKGEDA